MSDTLNKGKLRVAIDWDNVGIPMFTQDISDPGNLVANSPFMVSQLHYRTDSHWDAVVEKLPPDDPLLSVNTTFLKGLNPYGAEYIEVATSQNAACIEIGTDSTVWYIQAFPSTEYTLWVWLLSNSTYTTDGSHTLAVTVQEYEPFSGVQTVNTAQTISVVPGNDVIPIAVHFTTNSATGKITLVLSKSDSDASPLDITVLGLMLMTGDTTGTEPKYNAAGHFGYVDEITPYILSMQGKIGKTQWESPLFDEGTLSITVDNQDKRFSPEYADSPLFGLLNPYCRVWVIMEDSDGLYHLLWSGFTQQYTVQPGIANSRQATITCRQGLFNIQAQDPSVLVAASNIQSNDAIKILFSGGYNIPTGTDNTAFTPNFILEDALNGQGIPIFGTDFVGNNNADYGTELGYVSELNGNCLFLTRYGRVFFSNWEYINGLTGDTLDYSFTTEANYIYSPQDLYKQIVVNYNAYSEADSGIEMQGQEFVIPSSSTNFPLTIYPMYNGLPLIGDVLLDVSSFIPVDPSVVATGGTANASFTMVVKGIYTYYTSLANNSETDAFGGIDLRLSLVSRSSDHVWYATATNQQYLQAGYDLKSQNTVSYNNPLITAAGDAETFAQMQADRRATIFGWFDNVTIVNKNDDTVDFIINHTLGDVVNITEDQTGGVTKYLMIIGESFNFTPTYLQMQYTFAPIGASVPDPCDDCTIPDDGFTVTPSTDGSGTVSVTIDAMPTGVNCTVTSVKIIWGGSDPITDNITEAGTYTHDYGEPGFVDVIICGNTECGCQFILDSNVIEMT